MALVKCISCGNEVSDKADCCPKCGAKIEIVKEDKIDVVNKICKECGQEIDLNTGICTNCGYDSSKIQQKKKEKKKKLFLVLGMIFLVAIVVVVVCIFTNANKGKKYIIEACEELADEENGLPDIEEIYVSEEIAEDSLIDYVYRVYIEYEGSWGTRKAIFLVDDEGETYFATEYGDDKIVNYLTIAEFEVNGIEGFFEPSDNWEELSSSEVRDIEKKFD